MMGRVLAVVFSLSPFFAGCGHSYSPPMGGEQFQAAGKLTTLESPDWPVEREQFVRDLTEQETTALRYFIEHADYVEYPEQYSDRADVPIVHIDGVRWWVYRSSLFRVQDGGPHWRKTVTGLSLGDRHGVDFTALIEWREAQQ